jgi:putative SOS response-associated peptidase YedK
MPAVLASPGEQSAWLSEDVGLDEALDLVRPLPDGTLEIAPADVPAKPPSDQLSLLG